MSDCLFCKMRDGEIPVAKVVEDDQCFAVRDINPVAPMHVLVIPKRHIATLNDVGLPEDEALVGHLHAVAAKIAASEGQEKGWRALFNVGKQGGQHVFHIHLHVVGGRPMGWHPG